jgi:dihydrofolate reductase
MSKLRVQIAISLDGYVAGPEQSLDNPLGIGGEQLHEWVVALAVWRQAHGREGGEHNASSEVIEEAQTNVGAAIMGRNMFGGGPGPWQPDWQGWWGDDPPFHTPVFVLTHHEREPLQLSDTTFHFVTDGIESALAQAREAAGEEDVSLGGGAAAVQQYLAAGLVDQLDLHVVPIILGSGARLFDNLDGIESTFEVTRVIEAPGVTHLRYAIRS